MLRQRNVGHLALSLNTSPQQQSDWHISEDLLALILLPKNISLIYTKEQLDVESY